MSTTDHAATALSTIAAAGIDGLDPGEDLSVAESLALAGVHATLAVADALRWHARPPADLRERITRAVRAVTDGWPDPLDEVLDIPPIVTAVIAAVAHENEEDPR